MGQARSPMVLYCCFNGCDKSRNISVSTPRCAKKLGVVKKKFYLRYVTQCEIRAKNCLVDSLLCFIARSQLYLFAHFYANSQTYAKMT
jgi:hypothetical protein